MRANVNNTSRKIIVTRTTMSLPLVFREFTMSLSGRPGFGCGVGDCAMEEIIGRAHRRGDGPASPCDSGASWGFGGAGSAGPAGWRVSRSMARRWYGAGPRLWRWRLWARRAGRTGRALGPRSGASRRPRPAARALGAVAAGPSTRATGRVAPFQGRGAPGFGPARSNPARRWRRPYCARAGCWGVRSA